MTATHDQAGRRLTTSFSVAAMAGLCGSCAALLGTAWDARYATEDQLVGHFLKWFSAAYGTGAFVGLCLIGSTRLVKVFLKVMAWSGAAAVLSAVFVAELARADALSLFAIAFLLVLPVVCGGVALAASVRKLADRRPDS
jgi:hypothetical protein